MAREGRLYTELAKYYDQIYHWKNYRKEIITIERLIREHKNSQGNDLLDVACGTGKHLSYLREDFNCTGIDSSRQMLAVARKSVGGVTFLRGNMADFELRRHFDVILCLFSSVGHLGTRSEIRRTFLNFSGHMKKGGVLIVEPWLRRSEWKDKTIHVQTFVSDSLIIARVNYGYARGAFSIWTKGTWSRRRTRELRTSETATE